MRIRRPGVGVADSPDRCERGSYNTERGPASTFNTSAHSGSPCARWLSVSELLVIMERFPREGGIFLRGEVHLSLGQNRRVVDPRFNMEYLSHPLYWIPKSIHPGRQTGVNVRIASRTKGSLPVSSVVNLSEPKDGSQEGSGPQNGPQGGFWLFREVWSSVLPPVGKGWPAGRSYSRDLP